MEDQWLGPYIVEDMDAQRGKCRLRKPNSDLLLRSCNVKDLKLYKDESPPAAATQSEQPPAATASQASQPAATATQTGQTPAATATQARQPPAATATPPIAFLDKQVMALSRSVIEKNFHDTTLPELRRTSHGSLKSCHLEILQGGSSEAAHGLKAGDSKWNVKFGNFTEDQTERILELLAEPFPNIGMDITLNVLLPEALSRLVRDCCGLPQEQAEKYLSEGDSKQQ